MKYNYLSQESLEKMKDELNEMKTTGRLKIAQAISEAREKGDLRENAEYDAAKEAQGLHEAKITQLENAIAMARVVDTANIDTSKVSILTKVKVVNKKTKRESVYHIVSEKEADLSQGKISVNSPIGNGLLGKNIGDIAKVQTPAGILELEILTIDV